MHREMLGVDYDIHNNQGCGKSGEPHKTDAVNEPAMAPLRRLRRLVAGAGAALQSRRDQLFQAQRVAQPLDHADFL